MKQAKRIKRTQRARIGRPPNDPGEYGWIGETARLLRLARGMTAEEIAEATGLSVQSIYAYEAGERPPKSETIEAIARAMRVHPSVFGSKVKVVPASKR